MLNKIISNYIIDYKKKNKNYVINERLCNYYIDSLTLQCGIIYVYDIYILKENEEIFVGILETAILNNKSLILYTINQKQTPLPFSKKIHSFFNYKSGNTVNIYSIKIFN
jgi:hypothetical protein